MNKSISFITRYAPRILLIALFLGWTITVWRFSPSEIVDMLGFTNGYLVMFILSMLGGFTMFSGIPYHLILLTFAAGGLNPVLLGISAGIGVMAGDSTRIFLVIMAGIFSLLICKNYLPNFADGACPIPSPGLFPQRFSSMDRLFPFQTTLLLSPWE